MTDSMPTPQPVSTGFTTALVAFFRGLVRLIMILFLGALIGVGSYFGVPSLERRFVQPVEENTAQLVRLETDQGQFAALVDERMAVILARLESLETQGDRNRENFSEIEARFVTQEDELENLARDNQERLQALDALESQLAALQSTLDEMDASYEDQVQASATQQAVIDRMIGSLVQRAADVQSLRNDIQLVKALELLTRARLALARSDTPSALEEVRAAQALLRRLQETVLPFQWETLAAIQTRLELAFVNLTESPLLAIEDLEIAWQLLLRGLPGQPGETPALLDAQETPSPEASPSVTPAGPTTGALPGTPTPSATP